MKASMIVTICLKYIVFGLSVAYPHLMLLVDSDYIHSLAKTIFKHLKDTNDDIYRELDEKEELELFGAYNQVIMEDPVFAYPAILDKIHRFIGTFRQQLYDRIRSRISSQEEINFSSAAEKDDVTEHERYSSFGYVAFYCKEKTMSFGTFHKQFTVKNCEDYDAVLQGWVRETGIRTLYIEETQGVNVRPIPHLNMSAFSIPQHKRNCIKCGKPSCTEGKLCRYFEHFHNVEYNECNEM